MMTAEPRPHTDAAGLADAGLLRLATAGSVDDGKSTLIGRLLYDSKAVLADQLEHVEEVSRKRGSDVPDLSLLTDGLRAEREQGITIDVAYRYFATARRTFILADTPGHVQYTRNMVTGASTADLAIVLIDARKGVIEQTKRHAYLSALLGIPHLVVAVNKMDLVDWQEDVFDGIVRDFLSLAGRLRG
ncbi:GTP-binding protein, partial [Paraconexibacter sp.]|uniref:GTP-binding protein n=1 Tax=Paraconexibacter sp. TaxID=2949640 RepID=UPI00356B4017